MEEGKSDLEIIDEVEINEKDRTNFRNFSYSKKDLYYRKAKEEGFRARSVYKLKEINENFNVLDNVTKVIDLCAAPGSWSQMLRLLLNKTTTNPIIVSVDIQDIVPIEGVTIIKGDLTKQETIKKILSVFNNEKVDIVVFDGAPDVTGFIEIDVYMQVQLMVCAVIICLKILKNGGKFVGKIFNDKSYQNCYYNKFKSFFDYVHYFKPSSSRYTSNEMFIICEGYGIKEKEVQDEIDSLDIENLFDKDFQMKNQQTKALIRFLIDGDYH